VELVYGHKTESERYKKSAVIEMSAYNAKGEKVPGKAQDTGNVLRLKKSGAASYSAVVDDGPWVKTVLGWKRGSKLNHGKVVRSTWDKHYAKYSKGAGPALGLNLEIVVDDVSDGVSGRVLFQGKPLPGAALEVNHKKVAETDQKGRFKLIGLDEGLLVVRASHSVEAKTNPDADIAQYITTLTLER
jgi:uncharacterized GH25 family protein